MRALLLRLKPGTDLLERVVASAMMLLSGYKLGPLVADGQRRHAGIVLFVFLASVYWQRSILVRRARRLATKAVVNFAELAAMTVRHNTIVGEHALADTPAVDTRVGHPSDVSRSQHNDIVKVRTLFISDVHLGTRGCQAEPLIDFLGRYDADTVFLVGDIVDGWRLQASWYWPEAHNLVVQKLLRMAREGTRLVYIPGNHDEFLRDYAGSTFGRIDVVAHALHEGADGRSYLVIHGDQFDLVVRHARWLAVLGDWAYRVALTCNGSFNVIRRWLGLTYSSLSAWAKLNVKSAVNYIGRFEELLSAEARRHDVQGVICGHIHHAVMHDDFGVRYINTGDWVESCSAVVEHYDGHFEIIRWAGPQSPPLMIETTPAPRARAAA